MDRMARRIGVSLAVVALVLGPTGRSRAGSITSLSSSGPGGSFSLLEIDPSFSNTIVDYVADFTSVAPLTITVGVDGPGTYFIGPGGPRGEVVNLTDALWTAFDFDLIAAPPGSNVEAAGIFSPFLFTDISRNPPPGPLFTNAHFFGGIGMAPSSSQPLEIGVTIGGTGPETFQVQLTPRISAVPEPSALIPSGTAAVAGLGLAGLRYRRRRAHSP